MGESLPGAFNIQNGLKRGFALSLFLFSFDL